MTLNRAITFTLLSVPGRELASRTDRVPYLPIIFISLRKSYQPGPFIENMKLWGRGLRDSVSPNATRGGGEG